METLGTCIYRWLEDGVQICHGGSLVRMSMISNCAEWAQGGAVRPRAPLLTPSLDTLGGET